MSEKHKCGRCFGEGRQYYEEDGRQVNDVCYHCMGSGYIDEQVKEADDAMSKAYKEAEEYVNKMWAEAETQPDFDGWNLIAAENMMSTHDYFRVLVEDKAHKIMQEENK